MFNLKNGQLYLDIYKISLELYYITHPATLKLPKYELYELGSQMKRSSESVNSNIIEGYGRNAYKQEFKRFLTFSWSSCLETIGHLEKTNHLYKGLIPQNEELIQRYQELSAKIYNFIKYVENNWKT